MSNLLTLDDHGIKDQSNIELKLCTGLLGGADRPAEPSPSTTNPGSSKTAAPHGLYRRILIQLIYHTSGIQHFEFHLTGCKHIFDNTKTSRHEAHMRFPMIILISFRWRRSGRSYESKYMQGRSQPHSPGWARVPLSSFCLKFWSIYLIFPQTLLIFFLILVLRVGEPPTREGRGYTTE